MKRKLRYTLFALILLVVAAGCTTPKKNTALSRWTSGVNTRYNIYFNGYESYKEALVNLEKTPETDYVGMIDLHPVEALARSQTTNSSFERAIEKCQKAIQLRSLKIKPKRNPAKVRDPKYRAFLKQEEYNPFLHKAWLLMAKAQYYKGDFMNSLATSSYTSKHFTHLPYVVQEAQVEMLMNYVALGWQYEAEDVINKLNAGEKMAEHLVAPFSQASASWYIAQGKYTEALPFLRTAAAGKNNKTQRARLNFALAQVQTRTGDLTGAYASYAKVIKLNPSVEVEFNARIKQTEVLPGGNTKEMLARLRRMARDARNKPHLDQVFYAMGNVSMKEQDTLSAIGYYQTAIDTSQAGGMNKAVADIALADIWFVKKRYVEAQPLYTEAATLLKETHADYDRIKKRSEVLDELVVYVQNVHLQDSLQALARMSETERMAAIDNIIADLNKKEEEEKKKADDEKREEQRLQNLDLAQQTQSPMSAIQGGRTAPTPTIPTGDNSWYFYNTALASNGKTEFQRRWGRRRLEDNWRRRDKTVLSFDADSDTATNDATQDGAETDPSVATMDGAAPDSTASDPKNPNYYLKDIPLTPDALAVSNEIVAEGLYNMGVIYTEKMRDFTLSLDTYNELLTRMPDNMYLTEIFYNMYLIGMLTSDEALTALCKAKLIEIAPDSKQTVAVCDPNYFRNLTQGREVQDSLYRVAYNAYLEGEMDNVQERYNRFKTEYPSSAALPQFGFLNALSYVPTGNAQAFKENLSALVKAYPESSVAPPASDMLKGLSQGLKLSSGNLPPTGMRWRTTLIGSVDSTQADTIVKPFIHTPDSAHSMLFVYSPDSVNVNKLLYDIASFNFSTFFTKEFDIDIRDYEHIGMIIIRGFSSFEEVLEYKRRIGGKDALAARLPKEVMEVMISDANFELLSTGRTLEAYLEFFDTEILKPQLLEELPQTE